MKPEQEELYAIVGLRLRTAREERNLTQQEVADQIGKARTTYSGMERGIHPCSLYTILKLGQILGQPITYFLFGSSSDADLIEYTRQDVLDTLEDHMANFTKRIDQIEKMIEAVGDGSVIQVLPEVPEGVETVVYLRPEQSSIVDGYTAHIEEDTNYGTMAGFGLTQGEALVHLGEQMDRVIYGDEKEDQQQPQDRPCGLDYAY